MGMDDFEESSVESLDPIDLDRKDARNGVFSSCDDSVRQI